MKINAKRKKIIFIAILVVLIFSAIVLYRLRSQPKSNLQIANPASVFCVQQGGKLVIKEDGAGQLGICNFDDGSYCEEWAYYRNECKKGENY